MPGCLRREDSHDLPTAKKSREVIVYSWVNSRRAGYQDHKQKTTPNAPPTDAVPVTVDGDVATDTQKWPTTRLVSRAR